MSEVTWQQILDAERESNRLREEYRLAQVACSILRITYGQQNKERYENPSM